MIDYGILAPVISAAEKWGQKTALIDAAGAISFAEFLQRVRGCAATLEQQGIRAGQPVLVTTRPEIDVCALIYALWSIGALPVPLHPALKQTQIEHIYTQFDRPLHLTASPTITNEAFTFCAADVHASALVIFTSGSTAAPKGVIFNQTGLLTATKAINSHIGVTADDRVLTVLPLSFSYGLLQLLTTFSSGSTLRFSRELLPGDVADEIRRERISGLAGVPYFWREFLRAEPAALPDLRWITNAGGRLAPEHFQALTRLLPQTKIFSMYGSTETLRSTILPAGQLNGHEGSIGQAVVGADIQVLAPDGRRCSTGEAGELVHCGPTLALGYWRDEALTAAQFRTLPDGQRAYFSKDLVRADHDGFLYFVGRADELFKHRGFLLNPQNIEEFLLQLPGVTEAAVFGTPDDLLYAVVAPSTTSLAELQRACLTALPAYMVPQRFLAIAQLPRTSSGKIARAQLCQKMTLS